jgi:hypothetical protein
LARTILEQVASLLPSEVQAKSAAGSVASEDDCEHLLALTGHDRARLASENLERMKRAPFTTQINHEEQTMRLAAMISNPETPEETMKQYQWALSRAPNDTMLHLNLGRFIGQFNRDAAHEEFRKSRPYHDVPFMAPDGTLVQ